MTNLVEVVDRMKGKKVAVFGDAMLDIYVDGTVDRISPEAPVPVVLQSHVEYRLGGCANAAANLAALGAEVFMSAVRGLDDAGGKLEQLLRETGINVHLIADPSRPTTTKTRIMGKGHQMIRLDHEVTAPVTEDVESRILEGAETLLQGVDAAILSDYGKGVLTHRVCSSLIGMAKSAQKPVVADPKAFFGKYNGATVITPNFKELEIYGLSASIGKADMGNMTSCVTNLLKDHSISYLLVTMGEDGMVLVGPDAYENVRAIRNGREVVDIAGAGDTVVAAYALSLAAGADYFQAMHLANCAAGVVVQKVGTAVCSAGELKRMLYRETNPL